MLDKEGFRPNVGIILANHRNEVFWGKRVNQHAWQFPQGGIQVYRPLPRRRIIPARIMSLWLASSASWGASFSVAR